MEASGAPSRLKPCPQLAKRREEPKLQRLPDYMVEAINLGHTRGAAMATTTEPADHTAMSRAVHLERAFNDAINELNLDDDAAAGGDDDDVEALATGLLAAVARKKEEAALRLHEETCGGTFTFGHQDISFFNAGLDALIGPSNAQVMRAMHAEHCESADSDERFVATNYGTETTSRIEWHFVNAPTEAGLQACGIAAWPAETRNMGAAAGMPRTATPLDAFEPERRRINERLAVLGVPPLQHEEMVALRLYLGPMYAKIQAALRSVIGSQPGQEWRTAKLAEQNRGNMYCTTIHAASSAVVRLSKLRTAPSVVYCGLANGALPSSFWRPSTEGGPRGGTELGFSGTTPDRAVATGYATCNGEGERGVLLEMQMGPLDAGAEVDWISQYPHEAEILLPPLVFQEVQSISLLEADCPLFLVRTRLRVPSVMLTPPLLTSEEQQAIVDALAGCTDRETGAKFGGDVRSLISGQPAEAARGLAHFMKVDEALLRQGFDRGVEAIVAEVEAHGDAGLAEHLHYVLHESASEKTFPNGVRDCGRHGERLADFVAHPTAVAHGLDEARVAALRLYTTAAFRAINDPLRAGERHPLPVTVAFIADGIKKLRAKKAEDAGATSTLTLWRGMKNLKVSDAFLQERRGGTELAPCSTTTDIGIAALYSASSESLLLKVKVANFMQYGAELQWLSAFPSEAEVLYPPLTYLQPTGRVERTSLGAANFTVVEVEPHLS